MAAAPGAAGVRVWHRMSQGWGHEGSHRCRRAFVLPIVSKFNVPLGVGAQGFCVFPPLAPDDADRYRP